MPRGDGTGPMGMGPTGRGRGGCINSGFFGTGRPFGFGCGAGRGFGLGGRRLNNGFGLFGGATQQGAASQDLEHQARILEEQAAQLRRVAKASKADMEDNK